MFEPCYWENIRKHAKNKEKTTEKKTQHDISKQKPSIRNILCVVIIGTKKTNRGSV